MIRIRAFQAIQEKACCEQYALEHMKVLEVFGITKITTAGRAWMDDPCVFVIVAESMETGALVGGARVHIYNPEYPLPIVQAVEEFDPRIRGLISHYAPRGTGEMCGLWNARSIAGYGIGTVFLARACITVGYRLGLKTLFVLCGEHTLRFTLQKGFLPERRLGNKGSFYYPKEGLVATGAIMEDVNDLSHAESGEKEVLQSLRERPRQIRREISLRGDLDIYYDLDIPQFDFRRFQRISEVQEG